MTERAAAERIAGSPLRIAELAADPALPAAPRAASTVPTPTPCRCPSGPGGDEGEPLVVDLVRTGGLLVTGPQGSGRSSALEAFARHLTAGSAGLRVGRPVAGRTVRSPAATGWTRRTSTVLGVAGRATAATVRRVADDVGTPAEWPALDALPALGGRSGVTLVAAAATAGQLAGHYQGPVAHLRRSRSGLLLCPGAGDAEAGGSGCPGLPLPARPG